MQPIALQVIAVLERIAEPQHLRPLMGQEPRPAAGLQVHHRINAVVQQDQPFNGCRQPPLLQQQAAILKGPKIPALITPPQPTNALTVTPSKGLLLQPVAQQQHLPTPAPQIGQFPADAALQPTLRVVVRKQHETSNALLKGPGQLELFNPLQGIDRRKTLPISAAP